MPEAIEDARENARINGIENAQFFVGKAEEVLPREYEENQAYADVIVVDPPRKGCDAQVLQAIATMAPQRLVMVSCNSASLARDCKELAALGYQLVKAAPVDLFPRTTHVETVALLSKCE